jgi:tetratricopeptide (TPR) repeat protein
MRSIELDPSLSEAHNSLAYVRLYFDWDWAAAEAGFKRALALNPADGNARHWYSHYLLALGRFDESLAEALRAVDQDPLSAMMTTHLGEHYRLARQYDLAVEHLEKALELNPRLPNARMNLGETYVQQRRYPEAEREFRSVEDVEAGRGRARPALVRVRALAGRRAEALRDLAELARDQPGHYVAPHELAWCHAALGDEDRAIEWLEKAYAERSPALVHLKIEPLFDPLRGDPRFADMVRRVGLPP